MRVRGRGVAAFLFKQTVTDITFVTATRDIELIAGRAADAAIQDAIGSPPA